MLDYAPRRGRPRAAGDRRRRRRGGAPARHGGQPDAAAGDRRAGAAEAPGRPGLAAVDRADAGRDPGGDRRRSAAPATPGCSPCASSPPRTRRCGPGSSTSRPRWPTPPGRRTPRSGTAWPSRSERRRGPRASGRVRPGWARPRAQARGAAVRRPTAADTLIWTGHEPDAGGPSGPGPVGDRQPGRIRDAVRWDRPRRGRPAAGGTSSRRSWTGWSADGSGDRSAGRVGDDDRRLLLGTAADDGDDLRARSRRGPVGRLGSCGRRIALDALLRGPTPGLPGPDPGLTRGAEPESAANGFGATAVVEHVDARSTA